MQRTGGTSLTDLLMEMSEHRTTEHEPFNWAKKKPRQFWPITEAFNNTKNVEQLRESLADLLSQRFLIKHCYELLSLPFNGQLMQAAAGTPYKHVLLLRRDEPARLISKFIAEAQGTWFKDYSRKVFTKVAEGERELEPMPVDRVVGHFRHSQEATRFVANGLRDLEVPVLKIYYEDLYTGPRDKRLEQARALFSFLDFTTEDLERHHGLIEEKIFHSGQNTRLVAPHVPNLGAVLEALHSAGCDIGVSSLSTGVPLPSHQGAPAGPRERIARECAILAQTYGTQGPYLEIGNEGPQHSVLLHAHFANAERHFLSHKGGPASGTLVARIGNPNDMRDAYADGMFGTVFWISALTHDRHFWRTADEITRVLAPGGALIVVAPTFSKSAGQAGISITGQKGNAINDVTVTQRVHAAPDYWRLSPQGLREAVFEDYDVREVRVMMMPPRVFGVGVKAG